MADTLSWEILRDLAAFRASGGCAISFYLNLDPSVAPTAPDAATRIKSLLAEGERLVEARKDDLARDCREGLKGDLERLRRWFDHDFDRAGTRGVAVFACGPDGLWYAHGLAEAIEDEVKIGDELFLAPLVRLVGRGDGILVAYIGRERAQVYRLRSNRLEEVVDQTEDVPSRHDQGGWSQARYERHIENIVGQHLRRVADTLDRCVQRLRAPQIVLVGADEIRSEFEALLSHEARQALIGWTSAERHATAPELLEAAEPLLRRQAAAREEELLARWREEAARHGRATAGWEETLQAASDGRVELLLVQHGADRPAYVCPACGRAQAEDGSCPLDGTTLQTADAGLDLAVHQTLTHGGTVEVIGEEHRDLEPVGGVAALLRF
jgi:peptide chain release factor subunit 1